MNSVELSAGTIEYTDTGGSGPTLVFVHGLTMDGTVWRKVIERLGPDFRCIAPTWPLGGHRLPMHPKADLSLLALASLIGEFLERMDLHDVVLVQNDWGGAQVLIANRPTDRIGALVLTSCEAFDNYPPGIVGGPLKWMASSPRRFAVVMQALRLNVFRRAPMSWGWMSKRPVPKDVMNNWFEPATTDPLIRRDLAMYVKVVPPKEILLAWAEANREFDKPVLVVWATEDRVMPPEHGRRLAEVYPQSTLVELDDTYTLIPEDRPHELADAIGEFARTSND